MPKNQSTAAQKARRLQAANGGAYTDVLHGLANPAAASATLRADAWLKTILNHLQELGWPASSFALEEGRYHAYSGPVSLDAGRDVDDVDAEADDADPDDPRWAGAPLWLSVIVPFEAGIGDLETVARAGAETPKEIAVRVDAELAEARRRRVQAAEPKSTTPCAICGDRYPEHHLLAIRAQADPVCPACVWDGDQRYRADLPYLAVQIDQLLNQDSSAPAGWAAVAAVLALTCGANLGRRLERELKRRRGWPLVMPRGDQPLVMPRWDQPLDQSWIWLPPREGRHPAFARLGAGASLAAITEALERHDPTVREQARRLCREAQVRWRPALWPAAIGYAVAFATQAVERDRHRKPVHVVESTSDGLSQIRAPFAVTGEASNVEGGLKELLEYLLFPLLLGHGLRDELYEPHRIYGAEPTDDRPTRAQSDARIMHEVDRATQVAVVLGQIPGVPDAKVIWDGSARPAQDGAPLGTTYPVNENIDELRQAARIQVAAQLYDEAGPAAMGADEAWARAGWWIPSDDAAHAVRQAHDFLGDQPHVDVLWAGHGGGFPAPTWVGVQVIEIFEHSTGPEDVPWMRVFDGKSLFGMGFSDVALVRRAEPAVINAGSALTDAEASTEAGTA
ncbi:hypothetical protein [Streptosporangium sp. NBC_01469]|uniref:hypothetical protein n=1 Tax=Streptosporangium sp. NBC_01469 TaxID=2903898 RepID=UPI002E29613B|nr:hypothetical protein [Streptosporangium sp. NBC_01469]